MSKPRFVQRDLFKATYHAIFCRSFLLFLHFLRSTLQSLEQYSLLNCDLKKAKTKKSVLTMISQGVWTKKACLDF
jgi:hypothetical protein